MEEPVYKIVQNENFTTESVFMTEVPQRALSRSMEVENSPINMNKIEFVEEEGTFCNEEKKKEMEVQRDILLGKIEQQETYVPSGVSAWRQFWKKIFG